MTDDRYEGIERKLQRLSRVTLGLLFVFACLLVALVILFLLLSGWLDSGEPERACVVTSTDLAGGHILDTPDLAIGRVVISNQPWNAYVYPGDASLVLGHRLKIDLGAGCPIQRADLDLRPEWPPQYIDKNELD